MTRQPFPDLTYPLTKIYEGINRQDYAELAALLVPRIREELQAFKPQISKAVDKAGYEGAFDSVMHVLDELEDYYKKFHRGKPRMAKRTAAQMHRMLLKEVHVLEQLSQR
jgi:succinate dehydrogenase/fumarate reductase flavoprotein subunit